MVWLNSVSTTHKIYWCEARLGTQTLVFLKCIKLSHLIIDIRGHLLSILYNLWFLDMMVWPPVVIVTDSVFCTSPLFVWMYFSRAATSTLGDLLAPWSSFWLTGPYYWTDWDTVSVKTITRMSLWQNLGLTLPDHPNTLIWIVWLSELLQTISSWCHK